MIAPTRLETRLDDKYTKTEGWLYMTGMQALVRLPIQQRLRDAAAGLSTGGYISGYRGSPMGRYDMELWAVDDVLKSHNIQFRAGLNEDLAATAIWGSQYVGAFPGAKVDGVFGIWYGKGPGVDRSGDALRHANLAGTSRAGGVVAIAGDDHGAKSSTVANFSDPVFVAVGMPVLYPSNTQELLDFGLHAIAMSRFSGCWVGMKVVTDVVEGGGSIRVGPDSPRIVVPERTSEPAGGFNIRPVDGALPQEDRLYNHKLHAALGYARANGLNEITLDPPEARFGIVAAGKAWQDVQQALALLGLSTQRLEELGVRQLKIGMTWPLDPVIVRRFARGLTTLVVVEEKRPLLEEQVRAVLYGGEDAPRIIGKRVAGTVFDPSAEGIAFANAGELTPAQVARVLAQAMGELSGCSLAATPAVPVNASGSAPPRLPGFCSGCPHNRSTKVIDGSRALAGIGCHTMAMLMNPATTTTVSHMGAEGVMWLGQQQFTSEKHVFANIGDGTFAHSGFLAVRQAIAAHVPITYKLLYNGFVAMTGGQAVETGLSPAQILHGLAAEGVGKMAVVTDDPSRYVGVALPVGVKVHDRSRMESVQREFRDYPDVSVILYDQPCATERRRLRKRGKWPDPPKRTFINAAVCEGCGDCGKVSNCMSIEPLETEFGRKRKINQESCNKDYTCIEGFCPSFVSVHGGALRKKSPADPGAGAATWSAVLPEPDIAVLDRPFNILVGGIGGTGVVTIGQTLAMAAYLQGLYSSNLDVTGLSQKYGAVNSHVRISPSPDMLHATRIGARETDTLIGCDLVVAAGVEAIATLAPERSRATVCADVVPTSNFARDPDWALDGSALAERLTGLLGDRVRLIDGLRLSRALLGDPIASNMMILGAAWQAGQVPLPRSAIERAIDLNGVAVRMNQDAFTWGRRLVVDAAAVERIASATKTPGGDVVRWLPASRSSTQSILAHRCAHLQAHTGVALAARYLALVERVQAAETSLGLGEKLSAAVADNYHRLLAVKDEWEVARLYASPDFRRSVEAQFEGDYSLRFHIGAWPFSRRDKETGKVLKAEVGPWLMPAFRLASALRGLRGTWLDPFRNNAERTLDASLIQGYQRDIEALLRDLDKDNLPLAVRIASLPGKIRGYGRVREANAATAIAQRDVCMLEWQRSVDDRQPTLEA